jgi:hypothetical protein
MNALKSLVAAAAVFAAMPAFAADTIKIVDPYIITSSMNASSGAGFFTIENSGTVDDRLTGAASTISEMTQLHTHIQDANGVMQMVEVPEGWVVPAGGTHTLKRGSDHVMFMGLLAPLKDGDIVALTLKFEIAGDVVVQVPVDLMRDMPAGATNMGTMPMAPAKP